MKPADLQNTINNADIYDIIDEEQPMGNEEGTNADDYTLDTSENIPAESKVPVEEGGNRKKTDNNTNNNKKDTAKKAAKIGEMNQPEEKKKGFFKRIFGKKDKEENGNDY